jgi:hypothetical protein
VKQQHQSQNPKTETNAGIVANGSTPTAAAAAVAAGTAAAITGAEAATPDETDVTATTGVAGGGTGTVEPETAAKFKKHMQQPDYQKQLLYMPEQLIQ